MLRYRIIVIGLLLLAAAAPSIVSGQGRPDPAVLISAQQRAMNLFAMMDGVWKGSAWSLLPSGEKLNLTQTERVGPFLDGSVKVIEGKGYEDDGNVAFNAFGIISFDPNTKKYSMRSYAQGFAGDFAVKPTEDGFQWEIPAGPITIRYTAVFSNGTWKEVGDRIMPGTEPVRIFEMTLTRVEDTGWPAEGAVENFKGDEIMNQAEHDRRVDYIEFLTTDIEASKKFYSEIFGWEFTDFGPDYTSFVDGRIAGGFVLSTEVLTGNPLVVLYSIDLEGIRDRIVENGGKVVREIFEFPGGRRFHFIDPGGNELAVWSER